MSAITPPQLPDPPLSRRAYAPTPPGSTAPWERAAFVPRPVGAITCFCLHLALPLTLLFAALFLLKQHRSGSAFRLELHHGVIKYFDLLLLAGAAGLTLLGVGAGLLAMGGRLEPRVRWRVRGGLAASVVVVVLAALAAEPVFRWSKAAAYARVNPAQLTADCLAVAAAGSPHPRMASSDFELWEADPAFPAYARSIGAKKLRVLTAGVYVMMASDLKGVREEGYYVPRTPVETTRGGFAARQAHLGVVSTEPPVYRYATR